MRVRAALACVIWACCSSVLFASETQVPARELLRNAAEAMQSAGSGRERIAALTQAVRGYEAGLTRLREDLREVALADVALSRELAARDREISRLLGVLQSLSRTPTPARLTHPTGPEGAVRAGLLIAGIAPTLQVEAAQLKLDFGNVADLRRRFAADTQILLEGLSEAQAARTALSHAVSERLAAPEPWLGDPAQQALLNEAMEVLEHYDDATVAETGSLASSEEVRRAELPVSGTPLRRSGDRDAAGITRPGILVATGPEALVTAPVNATLRYAGPLRGYGLVTLLEPEVGTLLIFAGLGQIYGHAGDVVSAGDPLGTMPSDLGPASQNSDGGGNTRPDTLYIEVREHGRTVDPESWFNTGRE